MDSWLGSHKQDLIFKNGPPARIASDGGTGEILIYSYPAYNPFTHTSFYKYTMYYADNTGIIYRWMIQQGMIPPEQMDVNLYIR